MLQGINFSTPVTFKAQRHMRTLRVYTNPHLLTLSVCGHPGNTEITELYNLHLECFFFIVMKLEI